MASRYVGQLGRYVGQSHYELAHIATYEVAMQASQGVIHRALRSLCVHPSRYIPSGARFYCFKALPLGIRAWAVVSLGIRCIAVTGSRGGLVRQTDGQLNGEGAYGSPRP
jgi:hypothetical protein